VVSAWIDWNRDGDFDPSEAVLNNQSADGASGAPLGNAYSFTVPGTALPGLTYARFRTTFGSGPGTNSDSPTGPAGIGEIEDHPVTVVNTNLDYGDAPDTGAGTGTGNYRTTASDNGPSHVLIPNLSLGATIDPDDGTLQNVTADADDTTNTGAADDEDGVATLPTITDSTTNLSVDVAVTNGTGFGGYVYCYIDFNRDGDFIDTGEQSTQAVTVPSATVTVNFSGFAAPTPGPSYLRCRLGTNPNDIDTPTGVAPSGEVEDYQLVIAGPTDYGDAPTGGTVVGGIARNYGDPAHLIVPAPPGQPNLSLGTTPFPDAESATQSTRFANGDDTNGSDDENGVTLTTRFGEVRAVVRVLDLATPVNPGTLCGWLDGAGGPLNGTFEAGEGQCLDVATASTCGNAFPISCRLTWNVSALPAGTVTYARFRVSTDALTTADGGTGLASDGEVEDYRINIQDLDAGDAPTGGTVVGGIARNYAEETHVLSPTPALYIGTVAPDADPISRASVSADGDDTSGTVPDDEEGVVLTIGAGVTAVVTVTNDTGQPANLQGWVDGFNALNGSFGLNESISTVVPASGNNSACQEINASPRRFTCTLIWPAGNLAALRPGQVTYARFRVASGSTTRDDAPDGEVEDYRIDIPAVQDRSDAPASYGEAIHDISRNLYLGSAVDDETSSQAGANADGDDTSGATPDDEDGVATFPTASTSNGQYTVSVAYTNRTGANAGLCGWVDFDRSGQFDADERSCVFAASGTSSVNMTFLVPEADRGNTGTFFARFRLASLGATDPTSTAASGEVEDYQITGITALPITLASVNSGQTDAGLWVEWTTATETRNIGFHLYGRVQGEDAWQPLTAALIPSAVIDSLDPQRYYAAFPGVVVDELLLEDWDSHGQTQRHGPFAVGRLHGFDAVTHAQRIDWAAIRAENAQSQTQRKTLARTRTLTQTTAGQPDALLWVETPGIQRLGYDALQAAGADFSGVSLDQLALTDNGRAYPRHLLDANGNGLFDAGDSVEFVGAVKETLYSARNAYRLRLDPALVKAANSTTLNPSGAIATRLPDTLEIEQQKAYSYTAPIDDPWYDAWLTAYGKPARLERPFDLPGYAGGDATLSLRVWGVTDWPGDGADHHLIVNVNGQEIADLQFDGTADASRTLTLPEGRVQASGNTLTLEAPGDTGFAYDIQALDGFGVTYQRHGQAHQGAWRGTVPNGVQDKLRLDGFQGEAVAWKGDQRRVGGTPLFIKGSGSWVAADARAIHTPRVQAELPTPAAAPGKGTVDYLILSHAQFIGTPALDDLEALQQGRGYRTQVIDVATLYAAYSDFEVDAEAIRRYLRQAKPRFVLLVGGDSYDYHDYLGLASQSFIPTHYVKTDALVTYAPADSRHVDYNDNGLLQAALGRLPVRTEAELAQVVAKLVGYQPPTQALLSTGPSDSGRTFAQLNEDYAAQLPDALPYQEFHVDDLGLDGAKGAFLGELNLTGALVSYLGHSSYRIWGLNPSHGILFWADDARKLSNPTPHIVTQWGCWNTYFVNPRQDTMANGFLFQNHGAAAVLGATALTDLGLLRGYGNAFFSQVGSQATLGEAVRIAQRRYINANPGAAQALRGFALLGDPAAPLP
jgi:hypothetical protein